MRSELSHYFYTMSKEQLILLLQELARRHASLGEEIAEILQKQLATDHPHFNTDELELQRSFPQSLQLPQDYHNNLQRIASYSLQLQQGVSPQTLFDDLVTLLQEAEAPASQYTYQQALDIYATIIDERLITESPVLSALFDRAINEFMPAFTTLLTEVSSTLMSSSTSSIIPLLPQDHRQAWLQRLFMLWLKRMDRQQSAEQLPEILLEIAWSEDFEQLQQFIHNALSQQKDGERPQSVDFSCQTRTHALEKFLHDLPPTNEI